MKLDLSGRCAFAVVLACALAAPAAAQTWPARPVRIIVPFAPGGGVDTVARFLAQKFTQQIGGTFVVENRPGGGGILGAELAARAAPDGYTLLTSAPEEFTAFMRAEIDKWAKVVKEANVRVD